MHSTTVAVIAAGSSRPPSPIFAGSDPTDASRSCAARGSAAGAVRAEVGPTSSAGTFAPPHAGEHAAHAECRGTLHRVHSANTRLHAGSWQTTSCNVITVHRRGARHPRGPMRPNKGRFATSRSSGAIEGTEGQAPCPRYVRHRGRYRGHSRRGDDAHREPADGWSRPVMTFTAIGGDFLRREQQCSRSRNASTWMSFPLECSTRNPVVRA